MSGQWKEVVKLAFKGQRFKDHALDLSAITELSQYQNLIAETAKTLWRASHPDRERMPRHFEDRTRLCLRRIEEGSAFAPLEVYVEDADIKELFEPEPTEVTAAIELAERVFLAIERDEPLPSEFPKSLLPEYEKLGQSLNENESIEVSRSGSARAEQVVRVTASTRSRLAALADRGYEDYTDVTGEVLEADVRQRRFQLWVDEKNSVSVDFSAEQEDEVTGALKEHRFVRVRVVGRGVFSPQGKPARVTQVEKLIVQAVSNTNELQTTSALPIEDILRNLAAAVPLEDWKQLPDDLSDNLDHYLYGIPKQ